MRNVSKVLLPCCLLATGLAQSTFEPSNFDIAEALEQKGVDLSTLPDLAALSETSSKAACSIACKSLSALYDSRVLAQGTPAYEAFTNDYWSVQQSSLNPYCVFRPTSSDEVSISVLISRLSQCPFAVKSGGHAAFAGASSIEGGITISLERFDEVTISSDRKVATIGPGNLWFDVYTRLQSSDLAVIGGRVSGIGVGGLTLGGGISFFSNIYGWACDNVASYEVVTASGTQVTASPSKYPDLFWALRGGGNNFGIVTKFNLNTIPLPAGQIWGGSRVHTQDQFPQVISAFYNLGKNSPQDPNAAQIMSFAYAQSVDLNLVAADLAYAKPIANAPIFDEYLSIPPFSDNTRIRTLTDLTQQFNASNPNGMRETYWATTYLLDQALITSIKDIFYQELASIKDAAGLVPAATMQVITKGQVAGMSRNGGNPLSLTTEKAPYLLLNLNMMWTNPLDDERILRANAEIVRRADEVARARGLEESYIYMNYASQFQDVVGSYGAENQRRLKEVAREYDPTGVFQRLQPGYFKLEGAPASGP